jgi:hypothetical protein
LQTPHDGFRHLSGSFAGGLKSFATTGKSLYQPGASGI